jgi:hypothetical protein
LAKIIGGPLFQPKNLGAEIKEFYYFSFLKFIFIAIEPLGVSSGKREFEKKQRLGGSFYDFSPAFVRVFPE